MSGENESDYDPKLDFAARRNATMSKRLRHAGSVLSKTGDDESKSLLGARDGDAEPKSALPDSPDVIKAYRIFIMLGIGALFPFNAFISAVGYFKSLYPDFPMEFALSLAFNYPSLIVLFLSIRYGPNFSFSSRTLLGLLMSLMALIAVPVLDAVGTPTFVSLPTTLLIVLLTGFASAVMFGSVLGLAAIFPPRFTNAVMIGNGVAGVIVALLRIFTLLAFGKSKDADRDSSWVFFGLAALVVFCCTVAFVQLLRLPVTRHYHAKHQRAQSSSSPMGSGLSDANDATDDDLIVNDRALAPRKVIRRWAVAKKLARHMFGVFFNFFVTLTLFPGMLSEIKSTAPADGKWAKTWFPVLNISMFMLFDWLGRSLPSLYRPIHDRWLWLWVLARSVFFALYTLCIHPALFAADWAPPLITVFFALSNGYLGTRCMMAGPTVVKDHERETAGIIMSFALNAGIFFGAHAALLMLFLVTHQNPFDFSHQQQ